MDGEFAAQNIPGLGIDIAGAVIDRCEAGLHVHMILTNVTAAGCQRGYTVLDQVAAKLERIADAVAVGIHVVVRNDDAAVAGCQVYAGFIGEPQAVSDLDIPVGADRQVGLIREPTVVVIARAHIQQFLGIFEILREVFVLFYDAVCTNLPEVTASFQNELAGVFGHILGIHAVRGSDVEAVLTLMDISG